MAAPMHAVALKGSDIPHPPDRWTGAAAQHPWSNPDGLVLFFSSGDQQCASPAFPTTCDQPAFWQTALVIPAELNAPGLINLQDPRIGVYELTIEHDSVSNGCGRGLGSGNGFWGTLNIHSSYDNNLVISLRNSGGEGHPPANGDYVVHRCGAPPPRSRRPRPPWPSPAPSTPPPATAPASIRTRSTSSPADPRRLLRQLVVGPRLQR